MATAAHAPMAVRRSPAGRSHPHLATLLAGEVGYALREMARSRVAVVLTFLLPLVWLVLLGALIGDERTTDGVRIMQFVTPTAGVMGILFGTYTTVAASLADARERGVLKRVRGTPLPGWLYVAARVGAATTLALGSLVLMVVVGVVGYQVEVVWRTTPATVVTALVAPASLAALGLAVAALSRTAAVARAATLGTAVTIGFLSGVMGFGDLPAWADRAAAVFPLKPFHDAIQEQFDPNGTWAGWDAAALAMLLVWGAAGALVAARRLRFDPARPGGSGSSRGALAGRDAGEPVSPADALATPGAPASSGLAAARSRLPVRADDGRPGDARLVAGETRWAMAGHRRDLALVFFSLLMPVGLYVLIDSAMAGSDVARAGGDYYNLQTAVGMVGWSVLMTAFLAVPEAATLARDHGVLKRLRGTPLPPWQHVTGRALAGVVITLVAAVLVLATGVLARGLELAWSWLPVAALLLVLGTATLTACGFALAGALRDSKAVNAAALAIALPVSFFSGVFAVGQTPAWMETVGALLPVRHLTGSMVAALDPAGPSFDVLSAVVMLGWLVGAAAVALRLWRRTP